MGAVSAISPPFSNRPPPLHISNNNRPPLPSLRILRCSPIRNPRSQTLKFVAFTERNGQQNPKNGGGGGGGKIREESGVGGGRGEGSTSRLNIRWRDVLDPDPENIAAVGLAGLLAWASVSVLWQLLFISIAILLAALNVKHGTESEIAKLKREKDLLMGEVVQLRQDHVITDQQINALNLRVQSAEWDGFFLGKGTAQPSTFGPS